MNDQNKVFKTLCTFLAINLLFPISAISSVSKRNKVQKTKVIFVKAPGSHESAHELIEVLERDFKKNSKIKVIDHTTVHQLLKRYKFSNPKENYIQKAIELINQGRKAYTRELNPKKSIQILNDAEKYIIEKLEPSQTSSELLVKTVLQRALVRFKTKQKSDSKKDLQNLFKINPHINISLKGFPPSFKRFIKKIDRTIIPQNSQLVEFKTRPSSVEVYVNGLHVGSSPMKMKLQPDEYRFGFSSPSRKPVKKIIQIKESNKNRIKAKLAWNRDALDRNWTTDGGILTWKDANEVQKLSLASKISSTTNTNKTVMIYVDEKDGYYRPLVQVYDSQYNQALVPIYLKGTKNLSKMAPALIAGISNPMNDYLSKDTADLYKKDYEQALVTDPRLANRPTKPLTKKPAFWIAVGAVVIGGVIGGILATKGNNDSSSSSGDGSLVVDLGGI